VLLDQDAVAAVEIQLGAGASAMARVEAPCTAAAGAAVRTAMASPRAAASSGCGPDVVTVELTGNAICWGNLSVRKALHLLPDTVVGGSSRHTAAAGRLTVVFDPGETDVAGDKMLLRCRGAVADFFARTSAKAGDLVRMRRDQTGIMHVQVTRH
jgi:hypothetical protein